MELPDILKVDFLRRHNFLLKTMRRRMAKIYAHTDAYLANLEVKYHTLTVEIMKIRL